MNHWAAYLADLPASLQRAIARANRVSLPRNADAKERLARLRQALCHAHTVRERFFGLDEPTRAALRELCTTSRGLSLDALEQRFGLLRPLHELRSDPRARSISEQLLLLGWLLPRPATPQHPARYLLPPELRTWLPHPLTLSDHGPAPMPQLPPALRVTHTLLLSCAAAPLPIRPNGTLGVAALRTLLPRLAPFSAETVAAISGLLLPLLSGEGLLAPHGVAVALTPAARTFLERPPEAQLAQLRAAWLRQPRPDPWARTSMPDQRSLDWPALRRRLAAWALALPAERLIDPAELYGALTTAYGPLADPVTHPLRPISRTPWQDRRATAIWDAALRGPLTWFGYVAWEATEPDTIRLYQPARAPLPPPACRYTEPGELLVPHGTNGALLLDLLPFMGWRAVDAHATTLRLTTQRSAHAASHGLPPTRLQAALQSLAGPIPPGWDVALGPEQAELRIVYRAVVLADDPAVLARAARGRSVRRHLETQLAAGIALAPPDRVPGLVRALERQGVAAIVAVPPPAQPPVGLSPAECALLATACAHYRAQMPLAGHVPLDTLIDRLRAASPAPVCSLAGSSPGAVDQLIEQRGPLAQILPSRPQPVGGLSTPQQDTASSRRELPTAPQHQMTRLKPQVWSAFFFAVLLFLRNLTAMLRTRPHTANSPLQPSPPLEPVAEAMTHNLTAQAEQTPDVLPHTEILSLVRIAIARRRLLCLRYCDAAGVISERSIRPLQLERHAGHWYLRAYCALAGAERSFRTDRLLALSVLSGQPRQSPARATERRRRRQRQAVRQPRTGFFSAPPSPPAASPLVRVWLDD